MRLHQWTLKWLGASLAVFAVTLLAVSCASQPANASGKPGASCKVLSFGDLGTYGASFFSNPFMQPSSILSGTPEELVVLDLSLSLPDSATVDLDGSVKVPTGEVVARVYSLSEMQDFWNGWGDKSSATSRTRIDTLTRYYAPSDHFMARKGNAEYIVVLMGKNPLPRPAMVELTVSLNAVTQSFTFSLAALK